MNDFRKKLGVEPVLAGRFAEKAGEPHGRDKLAIEGIRLRGEAAVMAVLAPDSLPNLDGEEERALRMHKRTSVPDEAQLPYQDPTGVLRKMEALLLQRGKMAQERDDKGLKIN